MLLSGVAKFVSARLCEVAAELLEHFGGLVEDMRRGLERLPSLTEKPVLFLGHAPNWEEYNGCPLHQWHAHGDLPWLLERNAVGAYEALVRAGAIRDIAHFCLWVGELNARLRIYELRKEGRLGGVANVTAW